MLKTLTITLAIAAAIVANAMTQQGSKTEASESCCSAKTMSQEDAFMMEAQRMMLAAEGKQACCKSTAAKAVVKGAAGCCEADGGKHADGKKATKTSKSTKAKSAKASSKKS